MARLGRHHGAAFVRESMLYSHDIATVEYNANFHSGTDRKTAVPAQGRKVTVTPRGFILAMPQCTGIAREAAAQVAHTETTIGGVPKWTTAA
jgi:hypothetical protein